jgi:hypothetical protein
MAMVLVQALALELALCSLDLHVHGIGDIIY